MANTIIQIKRSTSTSVPANGSLQAAEQAYSFQSDKLFIGNTAGTGVIEIGGKYWVDTTIAAFEQANNASSSSNAGVAAAFTQANTARTHANAAHLTANSAFDNSNAAFLQANTARTHANAAHLTANAAFDQANTARTHANAAHLTANAGFVQANTARDHANAAHLTANAGFVQANTARTHANAAHLTANAAFDQANTARTHANAAHLTANAGFVQANTARDQANIAFATANSKFSSNGGTISGDVAIVGNLSVSGNTSYINVQNYRVEDPLIYLAGNNYISDIVDIGFVGNYSNGTTNTIHTGIFRDAVTKEYYAFHGYYQEPENNHIDPTANGFTLAVFNADIRTSNLNLGGVNAISWIRATYDQANTARTHANAAHLTANAGFVQANTSRDHANAAHLTANAAFLQANTARDHANAAHLTANAGFVQANTARTQANTALDVGQSAFLQANTARTHANAAHLTANAAFDQANTARTHANAAHLTANAAFDRANLAFGQANVAFNQANTAASNAVNASALSTGTVPSARISGSYTGITGVGTLTAGTWNADIIKVPYGGTGVGSFTTNGILYGNNAGDLKVTGAGTEGQVLQASATGVPQFGMLDGGSF